MNGRPVDLAAVAPWVIREVETCTIDDHHLARRLGFDTGEIRAIRKALKERDEAKVKKKERIMEDDMTPVDEAVMWADLADRFERAAIKIRAISDGKITATLDRVLAELLDEDTTAP